MTHTRASDEERDQRRAQQRELVSASIEQLRSTEGWAGFLRARRAFHSYSYRNVLLIAMQHPTATRVAGFHAWLKLGYCVRKGETGIRIWAPCPPSKKTLAAWRAAGADPDERPRTYWRLAAVFAQDQIAELPPPAVPASLNAPAPTALRGESHAELVGELVVLAGELGYCWEVCDTGEAEGRHNPKRRRIEISDRLSANGQLAAGVHELAHALVALDELAPRLSYAEEELVVESVAFCVCETVGLDTKANSLPDLTGWAEEADLEVLERAAALTARLADRIEAALIAEAPE
jgi:antirestriction protein ArdC